MNIVENEIVVLDIAGNQARVICGRNDAEVSLRALGFAIENDQMVRQIFDDIDRQKIVAKLIELGALFTGGRDWSPAELVDFYREQGKILTGYRVITWKSPTEYVMVNR